MVQNLKDLKKLIEMKNYPYDIYSLLQCIQFLIFHNLDETFGLNVIELLNQSFLLLPLTYLLLGG